MKRRHVPSEPELVEVNGLLIDPADFDWDFSAPFRPVTFFDKFGLLDDLFGFYMEYELDHTEATWPQH